MYMYSTALIHVAVTYWNLEVANDLKQQEVTLEQENVEMEWHT